MDGITFRCLYENCTGGAIFSGTVMDQLQGTSVDFKYVAGVEGSETDYGEVQGKDRPLDSGRALDYFILASYTPAMIRVLLRELKERQVKTVILPYLAPVERMKILVGQKDYSIAEFLTSPDEVLRRRGVKNCYFLYQNGEDLPKDYVSMDKTLISMEEGEYFEEPPEEIRKLVNSMEERSIDLKKAGYIKKSDWLFYLGVYGPDIREAVKSHYDHATLVMFTGPAETNCNRIQAKVYGSSLNMEASCANRELDSSITGCVKCIYNSEYITFRSINKDPVPHEVFGHFLLGTYNLNEHLGEMLNRFSGIREMIRVNAIPDCGRKDAWNHCYPSLFTGDYSKFWYLNIMPFTYNQVLMDVARTSPRNRFLLGTDQISYCFNGRILKKEADISFL